MKNKLWLLQKLLGLPQQDTPWFHNYDKAQAFVVRAKSEAEARALAGQDAGDEGAIAWTHAKYSSCDELTARGSAEVVLRDFYGT